MVKDKPALQEGKTAITDSSIFSSNWNTSNVPEFTEGKVASIDGMIAYKMWQVIYKDGVATEEKEEVPYIYIEINGVIKSDKLRAQTRRALEKQWGTDPQNWRAKPIMAKHGIFGKETFLTWAPRGKLD